MRARLLPPVCVSELSDDDPWWSLESDLGLSDLKDHFVCKFSNNCTSVPTNFERVSSLRKLMQVTDRFLNELNVTYTLASGTAVGAYRCNDVVPWDADVDVLLLNEDFPKLLGLLEHVPSEVYLMGNDDSVRGRSMDMASVGFPGFELMDKISGCLPLAIVDHSTGLYTDLLTGTSDGGGVLAPWYLGGVSCDSSAFFNGCSHWAFSHKCHNFSKDALWPPARCSFHTFEVMCPSEIWLVVKEEFGPGAGKPNIRTRGSDPGLGANDLDFVDEHAEETWIDQDFDADAYARNDALVLEKNRDSIHAIRPQTGCPLQAIMLAAHFRLA